MIRGLLLFALLLAIPRIGQSQGRVVINEYMPWPGSSCGTTAEFIELLNFGPGPVNIGCYILTDGDYSITIPANTILRPGQFYVIAGQDSIAAPCANLDSLIHVSLNWNRCRCTSAAIPTTGDGFLTDGGSASEQLVLLDPNLNVIDAVVRTLPAESNSTITTQGQLGIDCASVTFNLNTLNVIYETIGESAGRGNSFARRTDGDCGWVKDPQQSANATNNRGGAVSDIQYNFYYVKATTCGRDGKVAVTVTAADYAAVFPMSYILAIDTNSNGVFDANDQYINGVATTPNTVTIDSLKPGTYRLTLASVKGCYLRTFPFTIAGCSIVTLPLQLLSFQAYRQADDLLVDWKIEQAELLAEVILEGSINGANFQAIKTLPVPNGIPSRWINSLRFPMDATIRFVRLKMVTRLGEVSWSNTIQLTSNPNTQRDRIYPNPTQGAVQLEGEFTNTGTTEIRILNQSNQLIKQLRQPVQTGLNRIQLNLSDLAPGFYLIQWTDPAHQTQKVYRVSKG